MGFFYLTARGSHLVLDRLGFSPRFEALPSALPVLVPPIGHPELIFFLHASPFFWCPFVTVGEAFTRPSARWQGRRNTVLRVGMWEKLVGDAVGCWLSSTARTPFVETHAR